MGFGDRLKGLRDQAQQAVAENKDKIQGAVQNVGEAANARTHGKYADRIAKVGEKVSGGVEKLAHGEGGAGEGAADTDASAAPIVEEPADPVTPSAADEAAAGFPPEFE
jgi:MT0933-like antitoxin protein